MTIATYSCLLSNSTWLPICFHPFPCPEPPPNPSPDSSSASPPHRGLEERLPWGLLKSQLQPDLLAPRTPRHNYPGEGAGNTVTPLPYKSCSPPLDRSAHSWGDVLRSVGGTEALPHHGQRVSDTRTEQEGTLGAQIGEGTCPKSLRAQSEARCPGPGLSTGCGLRCCERALQGNERDPDPLPSMVGVGRALGGGDRSRAPSPAFHSPRPTPLPWASEIPSNLAMKPLTIALMNIHDHVFSHRGHLLPAKHSAHISSLHSHDPQTQPCYRPLTGGEREVCRQEVAEGRQARAVAVGFWAALRTSLCSLSRYLL